MWQEILKTFWISVWTKQGLSHKPVPTANLLASQSQVQATHPAATAKFHEMKQSNSPSWVMEEITTHQGGMIE